MGSTGILHAGSLEVAAVFCTTMNLKRRGPHLGGGMQLEYTGLVSF